VGEIFNMMFKEVVKTRKVRENKLPNSNIQQTLSWYADDTVVIVLGMEDNFHNVMGIFNQFLKTLGLEPN
jgi:hypothetical protein